MIKENQILRLEDSEGTGIYRTGFTQSFEYWESDEHLFDRARHPNPCDDFSLTSGFFDKYGEFINKPILEPYIFGFKNKKQFTNWMLNEGVLDLIRAWNKRQVKENRIKLVIYEGEIICGDSQAVIKNESKIKVREIPLSRAKIYFRAKKTK